jgi:hypothetical protein
MAPAKTSSAWVLAILGGLVLVNLYVFVWDKKTSIAAIQTQAENPPMVIHGSNENLEPLPPGPLTPITEREAVGSAGSAAPMAPRPGHYDGKVGKGTLGKTLKAAGMSPDETKQILRALTPVLDFKTIRAGSAFHVDRLADGQIREFDLELGKGAHASATRDTTGTLVGAVEH